MSPEQARGAPVDRGADLWAFAVVLMEMLTGEPLFGGETVSDIIAGVLVRDLPWSALPPDTPLPVRRLLPRCLERDRKKGLVDAGAARLEIDDALSGVSEVALETEAARAQTARRTFLRIVVPTALTVSIVAGGVVWALGHRRPAAAARVVLSITPPAGVQLSEAGTMPSPPLIAPDGSAVMFTS